VTLVTKFLFRGHAIGKWTQGPQEPTGREAQRAPGARGERRRIPARLQDGAGGNCLVAAWIALQIGELAGLAQIQESGCAGGEA
jgi:hypothetical protein